MNSIKPLRRLCILLLLWQLQLVCPCAGQLDACRSPLFLTPYIQSKQYEQARECSQVGPLENGTLQGGPSYSGFFTVNPEYNSNLFFWFFPAMSGQVNVPLLLWLNGGPGFSSLFGNFLETGPFVVSKNMKLSPRNYTWNRQFALLFIDQPVGAGFSFTDNKKGYARNLDNSSRDLYEGLKQFFFLFSEYQNNSLYLTGESYAGKYIPGLAYRIHQQGDVSRQLGINLKGIAIGNGLIDPRNQMLYGELFYNYGLINQRERQEFEEGQQQIREYIDEKEYMKAYLIWDRLMLGELTNGSGSAFSNYTGYTYRYNVLHTTAPDDFKYYPHFVCLPAVRAALHVGDRPFDGNSFTVETYLFEDFMVSAAPLLGQLLDAKYRVLLFSGALDIIVPTVGTENMIHKLKWTGAKKFKAAPRKVYKAKGETAISGYVQQEDNLIMVTIRNAGHAVPYDRPEVAYDLIDKFVKEKPI